MKNKLKLITTLLIISLLIIPISAITEYINYDSGYVVGTVKTTSSSPGGASLSFIYLDLKCPDIQEWKHITAAVYYLANPGASQVWGVRDIDIHTSEVPVTYKIGSNTISTGILQFIRHTDSLGALNGGILTFVFDTPIDTETLGEQYIKCDFVLTDFNLYTGKQRYISIYDQTLNCPYPCIDNGGATYGYMCAEGVAYKRGIFIMDFTSEYTDTAEKVIDITINRYGVVSFIQMFGKTGNTYISDTTSDDIFMENLYDIPYNLSIKNPSYSGVGAGEYFNYTVPSEYEEIDDNIAQLTYSVYDAGNPTQIISTNYNLTILNTTTDLYEPYKTGFNPGTMIIDIANNQYYNMSLEKYGYTPKDHYFSISGDTVKTTNMYPDYAGNYTVTFKVREHITGNFIEGAKIIGNGITKYTPYNGNVGFGDIDGLITYVVSKPDYVTVSGNATITSNQAIFIYMMTEEQALEPTPTPTPTPPPDLEQPTNLLESIKYAFAQMFGLTESADLETMDLFMGLGIIFAGAVLIASITKDALGAVVGALIGFIMSLALGFIPLWVLFVGFAGFAIYIIMTKTGGGE